MSYNSDKVQLGTTQSSFRTIENVPGDIAAGLCVHSKSDGTFTTALADGVGIGISAGKSLSDISRTAVVKRGTMVPLILTDGFNPTIGAQVTIDDVTGMGKAAGSGVTAYNAVFASGRVGGSGQNKGIQEDGTSVGVAYIDFPGGL